MFWSEEEVKGTGWHEGWYMAVVNDVLDKDAGRTSIVYVVEPSEHQRCTKFVLKKCWKREQ